eukprot:6188082-Pleurochrysis_carterae.AAC.7
MAGRCIHDYFAFPFDGSAEPWPASTSFLHSRAGQHARAIDVIVGAGLCDPLTIMRLKVLRQYLKAWQAQIP